MTAATLNSAKKFLGIPGLEVHDVTFNSGYTYDCKLPVEEWTFSVVSATGGNANGYDLALSGSTFTLTADGTPNTVVKCKIWILKKR